MSKKSKKKNEPISRDEQAATAPALPAGTAVAPPEAESPAAHEAQKPQAPAVTLDAEQKRGGLAMFVPPQRPSQFGLGNK